MRTTSILGLIAVLYLLADAAAASVRGATSWGIALLALGLATFSVIRGSASDAPGARRTRALLTTLGLFLAASLREADASVLRDVVGAIAQGLSAALLTDLALGPKPARVLRFALLASIAAAGTASLVAALPAFELGETLVLVPPSWNLVSGLALGLAVPLGLVLRLARRRAAADRRGDGAIAGFVLAVALLVISGATGIFDHGLRSDPARLSAAAMGLVLAYAHVIAIDPTQQLHAPPLLREVLALLLPTAGAALAATQLGNVEEGLRPLVAALGFVVFVGAWLYLRAPIRARLSPGSGRLLSAIDVAKADLGSATDLRDVGEAVLAPLQAALGAPPVLYTLAPARALAIDAAGAATVQNASMGDAFETMLAEGHGELVRASLETRMVREPALRPVASAMDSENAMAVVPVGTGDGVEGVLLLRSVQRRALTEEELRCLHALAEDVAARLSLIGGRDRALKRIAELSRQVDARVEEREALESEGRQLQDELRAMRDAPNVREAPVAYSDAMRRFLRILDERAPVPAPLTLIAAAGIHAHVHAERAHEASGRGPFVSMNAREGSEHLFGDGVRGGALRLAHGGTLFIANLPALERKAQVALAEALALRQARPITDEAQPFYPIDVRLVVSVQTFEALATLDPSLVARLGDPLAIPTLAERREDLPSLILLAAARACDALGRPALGLEQDAVGKLVEHGWPGNDAELELTLSAAVQQAEGPRIGVEDLRTFDAADPLDGTFREVEGRLLRRALERAGGNKSEAARLLGLKRTTFLDKVRRLLSDDDRPATPASE